MKRQEFRSKLRLSYIIEGFGDAMGSYIRLVTVYESAFEIVKVK